MTPQKSRQKRSRSSVRGESPAVERPMKRPLWIARLNRPPYCLATTSSGSAQSAALFHPASRRSVGRRYGGYHRSPVPDRGDGPRSSRLCWRCRDARTGTRALELGRRTPNPLSSHSCVHSIVRLSDLHRESVGRRRRRCVCPTRRGGAARRSSLLGHSRREEDPPPRTL